MGTACRYGICCMRCICLSCLSDDLSTQAWILLGPTPQCLVTTASTVLLSCRSELVRANGMLEGDAWARLKSFGGVLAAISTSLQQATLAGDSQSAAAGFDQGSNMSVADAFSSLAEAFNMRFSGFNTGGVVVQHGAAHVSRHK